uniref:uncharacterized protein C8orf74 homolog n=1 Tax=Scatophagus argus TaxID=75038 RepID=UPI001ED7DACB|nr:uncharacterized protein C8orf74 homolog [Scatophagus argus]
MTRNRVKSDALLLVVPASVSNGNQREAGVQRLSCHFSWPEFWDERRCFHQEFVYDVAMFAAACGFPWPDVIRAAVIAKDLFPQLDETCLSECLPSLTSVHRHELTQFLMDTCITRRRLFQAVVGGAVNMSVTQLHLDVQLPPTPCPLAQGSDIHEWEHRRHQAELTSKLLEKERQLKVLREGPRFTLGEVDAPEDVQLDKEGVLVLVRAAVKAAENQMLESLTQEASLLGDIVQLKLQRAALATGRLHNPVPGPHPDAPAKTKPRTAKSKTGLRKSGNAV